MLSRNSRGRPINAPAAFIHPCRPIVAKQAPIGPGWAHELKHDGYRLQIHVRDGRVRLYTITGADWSKRYPLIVEAAVRIGGSVPFLMPRLYGSDWMACPISTRCIAG
jgi:ATP-dependent DNA ligase